MLICLEPFYTELACFILDSIALSGKLALCNPLFMNNKSVHQDPNLSVQLLSSLCLDNSRSRVWRGRSRGQLLAARARRGVALRLLRQDVDSEASAEAARHDATLRDPARLSVRPEVQVDATAEGTPEDVHCLPALRSAREARKRRHWRLSSAATIAVDT